MLLKAQKQRNFTNVASTRNYYLVMVLFVDLLNNKLLSKNVF
jgi:hypothetical protein